MYAYWQRGDEGGHRGHRGCAPTVAGSTGMRGCTKSGAKGLNYVEWRRLQTNIFGDIGQVLQE